MVRFPRGERAVGARHSFREPAIAARAVLLDEEPCPLTVRIAELERNALKMEEEAAEQARWVAETNRKRWAAERQVAGLAEDNAKLKEAVANLEQKVKEGPSRKPKDKTINSQSVFSERVKELAMLAGNLYDHDQLPQLFISVLKKLSPKGNDLPEKLRKCKGFRAVLKKIHAERDEESAAHLKRDVYNPQAFALLRLIVNMSKRECALLCTTFKYRRDKKGKRYRTKMAGDSITPAPTLFNLIDIINEEKAAERRSGLKLAEQADRRCAYVAGEFGIDDVIANAIEATKTNRTGGMSIVPGVTDGVTKATGHIFCVTGDGAGLTLGKSGVAIRIFPGSTELLNQSSNDCVDIVQYEERSNAEHYTVLRARLQDVRPALARLHRDGELRPGGVRSGVFVRICLVADKPFIRHVCGLTSHNADAFGGPMCGCCDADLYTFSFNKKTHYGRVTFAQLCARAHVPLHEALGEAEPAEWCFECDCCGEVRPHSYLDPPDPAFQSIAISLHFPRILGSINLGRPPPPRSPRGINHPGPGHDPS